MLLVTSGSISARIPSRSHGPGLDCGHITQDQGSFPLGGDQDAHMSWGMPGGGQGRQLTGEDLFPCMNSTSPNSARARHGGALGKQAGCTSGGWQTSQSLALIQ